MNGAWALKPDYLGPWTLKAVDLGRKGWKLQARIGCEMPEPIQISNFWGANKAPSPEPYATRTLVVHLDAHELGLSTLCPQALNRNPKCPKYLYREYLPKAYRKILLYKKHILYHVGTAHPLKEAMRTQVLHNLGLIQLCWMPFGPHYILFTVGTRTVRDIILRFYVVQDFYFAAS